MLPQVLGAKEFVDARSEGKLKGGLSAPARPKNLRAVAKNTKSSQRHDEGGRGRETRASAPQKLNRPARRPKSTSRRGRLPSPTKPAGTSPSLPPLFLGAKAKLSRDE